MTAGPRVWAGLLVLYVVWGSTYLFIHIALRSIEPFLMSAGRFIVAGIVVAAFGAWAVRRAHGRVDWREAFGGAALPGLLFFGFGNGSTAWAVTRLDTGVTSLVIAGLPFYMALLDRFVYRRRLSRLGWCGIVAGLGGMALLAAPGGGAAEVDPLGVVVVVAGGIAWAIGSLRLRSSPSPADPVVASGAQMLWGALFLGLFGIAMGEPWSSGVPSWEGIGAVGYLVVMGTLVGFLLFAWLMRNGPTPLVATYAFANPVVALLLGWGIEHEHLGPRTLGAAVLIVAAVALIVLSQARAAARAAREADGAAATLEA